MAVKLYVIPGSHPSKAAELMLEHKGIPFKRVDLVTAMHRRRSSCSASAAKTVPAMKADGRKVQGTREISRALDEMKPDPPLVPSDAVREAERWGDEELQSIPRRLAWWALVHLSGKERTEAARLSLQGYRVGLPIGVAARTVLPIAKVAAGYNHSTDENVTRGPGGAARTGSTGRRAPRRGRDRRRAAERRRLPDRHERAAAARPTRT